MLKSGLAFLLVALFACICCANPLAEQLETDSQTEQRDENLKEGKSPIEAYDGFDDDDGFEGDSYDGDTRHYVQEEGERGSEYEQGEIRNVTDKYEERQDETSKDEDDVDNKKSNGSNEKQGKIATKSRKRRFTRAVCGRRTYNPTFHMCCGGTLRSKSGISPACCGTRNYDSRFRMCCGGVIQSRSGISPACCGTRNYDSRFRMCCGGVIQSRSGISPACCGTRAYDARFNRCCSGQWVC